MAIPSKKRDAEEAAACRPDFPSPNPPPPNNPRWAPQGIIRPMVIPEGEHVAQIGTIEGFQSKRFDSYIVKIYLECKDGEKGTIILRLANDESRSNIYARNFGYIDQLMAITAVSVPNGEEPDWEDLTDRLQGIWFKIQVGISKKGFPYLTSLKPLPADREPVGPLVSGHSNPTEDLEDADFDEQEELD